MMIAEPAEAFADLPWDVDQVVVPECETNGWVFPDLQDEVADEWDPWEGVRQWRIQCVGRRPGDHMVRDLLHGSLLRDARPRWFHECCHSNDSRFQEAIAHLPYEEHAQAQQHLALHFLHRRQLAYQLRKARPADDAQVQLLHRLWRCWLFGVEVEWDGPGERKPEDVCGLAWLCPWCFGRMAQCHYQRLEQRFQNPTGQGLLVQARVRFLSEDIGTDKRWEKQIIRDKHLNYERYMRVVVTGGHYLLQPGQVSYVRDVLLKQLLAHARTVGVRDGLVCYQVSPDRFGWYSAPTFRHELTLLGELRFKSKRACQEGLFLSGLTGEHFPQLSTPYASAPVWWTALPIDTPQALRMLFAGTSLSYPIEGLEFFNTDPRLDRGTNPNGFPGVLSLPPLFMLPPERWWSYQEVIHGRHMVSPFGRWRRGALQGKSSGNHSAQVRSTRKAVSLQAVNEARQETTIQRRERLLAMARQISPLPSRSGSGSRKRGRPAARQELAAGLKALGHPVSERDLKWLRQALVQEKRQENEDTGGSREGEGVFLGHTQTANENPYN